MKTISLKTTMILLLIFVLAGCTNMANRLSNIGQPPALTPLENPTTTPDYKFVSMPMPDPIPIVPQQPNSLWQAHRKGFFKDQRASNIGDILTVVIELDDEAEIENETLSNRQGIENSQINGLLGFEGSFNQILPDVVDPPNMINLNGITNNIGRGEIEREEQITTRVAATITQILPNGNFVISGKQEIRVNFEVRELYVAGVIRPEDIAPDNSILHDQIAEARIGYGGRGQITDIQQPRYGHQLIDILYPF